MRGWRAGEESIRNQGWNKKIESEGKGRIEQNRTKPEKKGEPILCRVQQDKLLRKGVQRGLPRPPSAGTTRRALQYMRHALIAADMCVRVKYIGGYVSFVVCMRMRCPSSCCDVGMKGQDRGTEERHMGVFAYNITSS